MKILYISKHDKPDSDHQCDHLFLGLRALLGPDVVDVKKAVRAYRNSFGEGKQFPMDELSFTFGGLLEDIEVDREDIPNKIKNRYFDFIFYGSIFRDKTFLPEVFDFYPPNKIVFIDGEDDQYFTPEKGKGFYFKRELADYTPDVIPIQFAIPKEKIWDSYKEKKHIMSKSPPGASALGSTTRLFSSEADYYLQYNESWFALTKKKGGWDCLRHYEIMAAGALPYFEGLENCPPATMTLLPKRELILARDACDNWPQIDRWYDLMKTVRHVLTEHLTTEALAKRVLDRINQ